MRLLSLNEVNNLGSERRTVLEWGQWWGEDIHKYEKITQLYPQYTLPYITQALGNIFTIGKDSKSTLSSSSKQVRWKIKNNMIVEIPFTRTCSATGDNGKLITVYLRKKYYNKNDVFRLENGQLLYVYKAPSRISDNEFEYTVALLGSDTARFVDTSYMTLGRKTRYMYSIFPELSESGSGRFYFNIEEHVNWISTVRTTASFSSEYAMKAKFYETTMNREKVVIKVDPIREDMMQQMLYAVNNIMIFGESTMNEQLQPTLHDAGNNYPIIAGDGVYTQINKFADTFDYTEGSMSPRVLQNMLSSITHKTPKLTGNHFTFICNKRLWEHFNASMLGELKTSAIAGAWYYSQAAGKKVQWGISPETEQLNGLSVGNTFTTYEYAGNMVTFAPDRTLTDQYPDSGFGFCLDTGIDEVDGEPNILALKYQGIDIISGELLGLGGLDGKTSGAISTPIAGSQLEMLTYTGAIVRNPYKSAIIQEAIIY
jgi:hypothetical protein